MKKAQNKIFTDDLRKEYVFDYSKSKPNRFAQALKDTTAVVLQPDVAAVFHSAEVVNALLRSAIAATNATAIVKPRSLSGSDRRR